MPELVRMPEVSSGSESAVLAEWSIQEGGSFTAGQSIATVETDKAVVDVAREHDGVLIRRLVEAGAEVTVGDPIAIVANADESILNLDSSIEMLLGGARPRDGASAAQGSVEGFRDSVEARSGSRQSCSPGDVPASAGSGRIVASPVARRLADAAGLPMTSITGSGPNGRIVRADVEQAIKGQKLVSTPEAGLNYPERREDVENQVPRRSVSASAYTDVEHSRVRRAIAQRLTASKLTVPHFYLKGSARIDSLIELRQRINDLLGAKISLNDLIVKAVAFAHHQVPEMNVVWYDDYVRRYESIDIGIAVATDEGLLAPVLRDVHHLSVSTVAEMCHSFAERARAGKLREQELQGGTTTVTNLGMYGVEEFAAIINPPQSSIVAVGMARREPVLASDESIDIGTILRCVISVDHRAIDGAVAAEWMQSFLAALSEPLILLS